MSVLKHTISLSLAAVFAVAVSASASFAQSPGGQSWLNGQDRETDVELQYDHMRMMHMSEASKNKKRSPTTEEYQLSEGHPNGEHDLPIPMEKGPDLREKTDPDAKPTKVVATGYILPTGQYVWDGRMGVVPNPTLAMPGAISPFASPDSGSIPLMNSMVNMIDPSHTLRNTQMTNWEYAALRAGSVQALAEMRADPTRWKEGMRMAQEAKQQMSADNTAASSERNEQAWTEAYKTFVPLINVANEEAWQPCAADAAFKKYENAAWMVGQMYKQVYIPMAILFLLPGAIMTQVKVVVRTGFLFGGNDEDTISPFSGIMRSVIAIFLIPATQLIVSYTIDVGNSLTYEVTRFKPWFDIQRIADWKNAQTYNPDPRNRMNHLRNIKDADYQGKLKRNPEGEVKPEQQHYVTSTATQWFNTLESLLSQGMVCLNAFQFIMIEYLFLLGPVAAALFAWPGVAGETFKKVFANWMNGVVLCTLWKFWWSVILLCMSVRLYMMEQNGGLPSRDDPYEMFMAAAFGAMLMYIPFNPFDFRPGDLVSSVLEKAQQNVGKGGSGSASVGSAGPAGGSGTGAGNNTGSPAGAK